MNSKSFVPEEVEKGLHLDLINYLLKYNRKSDDYHYDVLITTDGYCTIVNWVERQYNSDFPEEKFELVDEDHQIVAEEIYFPDNHSELVYPEYKDEAIEDWLKDNPGWVRNEYGNWDYKPEEDNHNEEEECGF